MPPSDPLTAYFLGLMHLPPDTDIPTKPPKAVKTLKSTKQIDSDDLILALEQLVKMSYNFAAMIVWSPYFVESDAEGPGAEELWDQLHPVGEAIGGSSVGLEGPPVIPPVGPGGGIEGPAGLIWNSLEELSLTIGAAAALLARHGCISCPIGEARFTVEIPPGTIPILHLARANVPIGCSPMSFWLLGFNFEKRVALYRIIYNLPIPLQYAIQTVSTAASSIVEVIPKMYKFLSKMCKKFAEEFVKEIIGPCVAAAYIDIIVQYTIIVSCLKNTAKQLEEGIKQADSFNDQGQPNPPSTQFVPI